MHRETIRREGPAAATSALCETRRYPSRDLTLAFMTADYGHLRYCTSKMRLMPVRRVISPEERHF
jgi:hypothetical protein